MLRRQILALAASLFLVGAPAYAQAPASNVAQAKPGAVRMLITAAIRTPFEAVRAQAEQAVGKPLAIDYGSARGNLKTTALSGQDFEVAVLLPDVDYDLLKAGKIKNKSYEVARVPVAFGLRGDVPSPDVSSPEAVKQALLNARSVKYSPTGAALNTVRKVLGDLKIANQVKDSSKLNETVTLGPGEYEINIYPLSEILANKALRNLGPVIPALQSPAIITATIGAHANSTKAAKAVIKFLQSSAMDAALASSGMEKGAPGSAQIKAVPAP